MVVVWPPLPKQGSDVRLWGGSGRMRRHHRGFKAVMSGRMGIVFDRLGGCERGQAGQVFWGALAAARRGWRPGRLGGMLGEGCGRVGQVGGAPRVARAVSQGISQRRLGCARG